MNIKTIGIIGGRGIMGQLFQQFFSSRGFTVLISGRNTTLSNQEVAEQSDLLIFSVPIHATLEIIKSLMPYIKENTCLWDVTSIKQPALEAMLKTKAKEVVGGHPMFGAVSSIAGQVIVLSPGRGDKLLPFLQNIFEEAGAKIKILNADRHDQLMTVVQNLAHFTDIVLARTLAKTGIDIQEFLSVQSPLYRLKLDMMGRILDQDPMLYGNMQIQNPMTPQIIDLFLESARKFRDIVEEKDIEGFIEYFHEGRNYLGDFAKVAHKESDMIIEKMFQKKVEFSEVVEKAEIALLGPKNTYSDFAAEEVFPAGKTRKYCRTITEVFENVANGNCELGLVPVENKLAGSVHESYDAFWNFDTIEAIEEMDLKITHVLASLSPIDLKDIEVIISHSQPLSQCSRFLEKNRHIKRIAVSSTAEAVTQLSPQSAVIVPKKAAERAHLTILQEHIANSNDNFTRFFVIQRRTQNSELRTQNVQRTALAFELLKTKSGALLKVLQFFADEKINLLKLESKPVGDDGDIIFFVDTEGAITDNQIMKLREKVAVLKVFGRGQ